MELQSQDVAKQEMSTAGTGEMLCITDAIKELQAKGYIESFEPKFDHLACRSGKIDLYPRDIFFDEVIRFENSSDPDDQSILYAISVPRRKMKGLYVESYELYHEEISQEMIERMKFCHALRRFYEGMV
jgi:hypothetical protein